MYGHCKCFHHIVAKVLVVLMWLSAVAFWYVGWKDVLFWGKDAEHWFRDVVIFGFLAFGTFFCGCCGKDKMMGSKCSHPAGCHCGDCDRCR